MAINPIRIIAEMKKSPWTRLLLYPSFFSWSALSLVTMTMQLNMHIFQVILLQNNIENSCGVPVWRQCPYAVSGQNASCTAQCRPLNRNDEYYVVILKLLPHADNVHLVTEIDIFWWFLSTIPSSHFLWTPCYSRESRAWAFSIFPCTFVDSLGEWNRNLLFWAEHIGL